MSKGYSIAGAPFPFLGTFSETQRDSFFAWVGEQQAKLPAVQQFRQIRSQQLRKSAGLLEAIHAADTQLSPTFQKATWAPSEEGHWPYAQRQDHLPAQAMAQIKDVFHTALVHQDDAVFHMNHLRCQIERQEDLAQVASTGKTMSDGLMAKLQAMFGQPEYQAVLVRDRSDQYKGVQRFRTHPLDDPTPWERDTRSGQTPQSE